MSIFCFFFVILVSRSALRFILYYKNIDILVISDVVTWWNEVGPQNLGLLVLVVLHAICDRKVPNIALTDEKCLEYLLLNKNGQLYTWRTYPFRSGWQDYKEKNKIAYQDSLMSQRMPRSRSKSPASSTSSSRCSSPTSPEIIGQAKEACVKRMLEAQGQLKTKKRKLESSAVDGGQ